MNNHQHEQLVRDRIARLSGKDAQQLFWDILGCIYDDLQTPKMNHDLGNDGYSLKGAVFFASYVPEGKYENKDTEDKIQSDFDKFSEAWLPKLGGKINIWAFLTKDNLMGVPNAKIAELNNLNDGCVKENWGLEKLVKLSMSLDKDDLCRIFEIPEPKIENNSYFNLETKEEEERTIIDEIFDFVSNELKGYSGNPTRDYIKLNEKIELNFEDPKDQEAVKTYFKFALTKVSLIEERIAIEEVDVQQDLQGHIFGKYYELKSKGLKNMDILHELIKDFTPTNKQKDPRYVELSKAFVLFHFDDCTIFEKTKGELGK